MHGYRSDVRGWKRWTMLAAFCLLMSFGARLLGQSANWMEPFPPFHIAGNLYYVGSRGLAAYLVVTPKGDILINSNLQGSVPQVRKSIEELGFRFSDVKILLISHAHYDHDAGSAEILRATGAKYMVMDADVPVVESGGRRDFQYGDRKEMLYPAAKVDRMLHDGDEVRLGGAVLTAHLTPGHTRGCTTWTMTEVEGGRSYHVVIVGSPNVNPGYRLEGNTVYPEIARDYEKEFRVLRGLPCDIFLGAHGNYFGMEAKYARAKTEGVKAFVDPRGYQEYVADRERAFEAELAKQRAAQGR